MKILTSTLCKIGGRDYNQDAFDLYTGETSACLVVCDGLGAYIGSEVASKLATKCLIAAFSELAQEKADLLVQPESVKKSIKLAHATILARKEKQPGIRSSCTTLAAMFTSYNKTTIAHIGDSRVYFLRNRKIEYQTVDHSLAQFAVERGEISARDIRTHKDQNKLTRVLGSNDYFMPPDTVEVGEIRPNDRFLLCTDGFWEYVYEEEIEDALYRFAAPERAMQHLEKILLSRVDIGHDNYTAIIAYVTEDENGSKNK